MADKTLDGQCAACAHVWPIAFLPQELAKVAKLAMAARCPRGCDAKVLIAGKKEAEHG